MMRLNELIKQSALDAVHQSVLSDVMFGTITHMNPIQIRISDKLIIDKPNIAISRTAYDYPLKEGDIVILIRKLEGQLFVVLDKAVDIQ